MTIILLRHRVAGLGSSWVTKYWRLEEYLGMTKSLTEYILYVFSVLKFLTRHLVLALVKEKEFVEVKSMGCLVLAHKPLLSLTDKNTVTAESSSSAWQVGIVKNNEKRGQVPTKAIENKQNQNHRTYHTAGKYFSSHIITTQKTGDLHIQMLIPKRMKNT